MLWFFIPQLTSDQLFGVYKEFIEKYPVVSIEDAFDQDDWDAWTKMNAAVNIQLVGYVFIDAYSDTIELGCT